jgi:uncharacterized protein YqgC (DUF456 family)
MDYVLLILGFICILLGILGSILPGLPGPPVSYLGLLLIHWTRFASFSTRVLIILATIVAVVAVLDYLVPIWGTKTFGGSKAGVRGSTIGLIIGMILLPIFGIVLGPFGLFGILGGPFIGAWIGETYAGKESPQALRAAFGSFIGFLAGTLMKIVLSVVLAFFYFRAVVQANF